MISDNRKTFVNIGPLFDAEPPQRFETEAALLGSILIDPAYVLPDVVEIVKPEHFWKPANAIVFDAMIHLYNQNIEIDIKTMTDRLKNTGQIDALDAGIDGNGYVGIKYLVFLAEQVPSAYAAVHYAKIVRDTWKKRQIIETCGKALHAVYKTPDPVDEQLEALESSVFALRDQTDSTEAESAGKLLQDAYTHLENNQGTQEGIQTGFWKLDEILGGGMRDDYILIGARPSQGKAQPLDAKILTPSGFVPMGTLRVGDQVIGGNGKPCKVTGVFPQGVKPVFKVTFIDGGSTECCDDHLWLTTTRNERRYGHPTVRPLKEIRETLIRPGGGWNHQVPYVSPVHFQQEKILPINPYLLGLWLGDGTLAGSSPTLHNPEPDLRAVVGKLIHDDELSTIAPDGMTTRIKNKVRGNRVCRTATSLRELGLGKVDSFTKFIPRDYLFAEPRARLQLLRGIFDTDGSVHVDGAGIEYSSVSKQLMDDVSFLVHSMGGTCKIAQRQTFFTYRGEKKKGAVSYRLNASFDNGIVPVASEKNLKKWQGLSKTSARSIVAITPVGEKECQCIAVDNPDRLYVTDSFAVTHNTAFMMQLAEQIALNLQPQPIGVFSLEMSKQSLAMRLLASVAQVDGQKVRRNMCDAEEFGRLSVACGKMEKAPLYIDDTSNLTVMAIRGRARRMVQRYGIKAIFIDYLQLCQKPKAENVNHAIGEMSRQFKAMSRELKMPVVVLSQLNRGPEGRDDHRPRLSDLRDSGNLEQDADVVMLLHREDYYKRGDPNARLDGMAEVIIAKQRNGPCETVNLFFDSATTRFGNPQ